MRIQDQEFVSPLAVLNTFPSKEEISIYRVAKCWMQKNNDKSDGGGRITKESSVNEVRQELDRLHVESMNDLREMLISGALLDVRGAINSFRDFNNSNGKYHETREKLGQIEKSHKETKSERKERIAREDGEFYQHMRESGAYDRSSDK